MLGSGAPEGELDCVLLPGRDRTLFIIKPSMPVIVPNQVEASMNDY